MGSQRYLAGASVRSVDQLESSIGPTLCRKARRRARSETGEAPAKAMYKLSKNLNVPPPNAVVAQTPVSHPLVSILGSHRCGKEPTVRCVVFISTSAVRRFD